MTTTKGKTNLQFTLLWKGLLTSEQIDQILSLYRNSSKVTVERHLLVRAFANMCLRETADYIITPKIDIYSAFNGFRRRADLMSYAPVSVNALSILLPLYIKCSQTRTWRNRKQVRAFKGIFVK